MMETPEERGTHKRRAALGDSVPLHWWVVGVVLVPVGLFVAERMWPDAPTPGPASDPPVVEQPASTPETSAPPAADAPSAPEPQTNGESEASTPAAQPDPPGGQAAATPADGAATFIAGDASREERWAAYCALDDADRFEVASQAGPALAALIKWRREAMTGGASYSCTLVGPAGREVPYTGGGVPDSRLCWDMRCPD